jgi:hypothetical protein
MNKELEEFIKEGDVDDVIDKAVKNHNVHIREIIRKKNEVDGVLCISRQDLQALLNYVGHIYYNNGWKDGRKAHGS